MKSIEFDEEQLQSLEDIAAALFDNAQDPRSTSYVRKRSRPDISVIKISAFILLPLILLAALAVCAHFGFGASVPLCVIGALSAYVLYAAFNLKRAAICAVKIYQHYAPDAVRSKCRFEPSCSDYMLLCIDKYGLIKGVKKGVNRLRRCNINNGGFDMP